jgi:L-lactate dehydrogenase complex protein LldE
MPDVGVATVRLLRRAGFAVSFPQQQSCCGQPFFNSGFLEETRRLARRTIDVFAGEPAVVLPSGSCTAMIRREYAHLFADEPRYHYRALRLAQKTYELSEFLAAQGYEPSPSPQAPTVTYHDSCHMCRLLGLKDEPRRLLRQAGCHLVEMEESDRCCGFGGLFSVRLPEVANAMTTAKLQQAQATAAKLLVTADPGCLMQMDGLSAAEAPPRRHLAVLLEELTR